MHGADHAKLISMGTEVRVNIANRQAALAMVLELKSGLGKIADGAAVGAYFCRACVFFAMPFGKGRLGIEGVHLAGATIHEEEDAVLSLCGEMLWLGGQFAGESLVAREGIDQPQSGEAGARLPEKLTACLPTWRMIRNEPGINHLIRVGKFIEVKNNTAEVGE